MRSGFCHRRWGKFPWTLTFGHFPAIAEHDGIEFVQTTLHHLHADPDVAFAEKRAIKVHGVGAVAGSHRDIEIHQQTCLAWENSID
jgi:hypothetical protein